MRSFARTAASTPVILDLSYEYDNVGNIKKVISRDGPSSSIGLTAETYNYDALDRLVQAIGVRSGGGSASYGTLDYSYDEIGNRLTESTNTYSYGTYNQLNEVKNSAGQKILKYEYGSGQAGRVQKRITGSWTGTDCTDPSCTTFTYSWSARDELVHVKKKVGGGTDNDVHTYTYDAADGGRKGAGSEGNEGYDSQDRVGLPEGDRTSGQETDRAARGEGARRGAEKG